jgi:hypothetical protein
MRSLAVSAAGVLWFIFSAGAEAQEPVNVRGKVVDGAGKPVAGAAVATFWIADTPPMQPYEATTSDAKGEFALKVNLYGRAQALLAMDKEHKTGGLAVVEPKSADKPAEIKLGPLVHVHGKFYCKELGKRPSWTNVYMMDLATSARIIQCASKDAKFSFHLPPGKYQFWGYGSDINNYRKKLTLAVERTDVDLGMIDVPATAVAKHIGKVPPSWTVTDARGAKKNVRLEDYKGKWVFLEFWGYW